MKGSRKLRWLAARITGPSWGCGRALAGDPEVEEQGRLKDRPDDPVDGAGSRLCVRIRSVVDRELGHWSLRHRGRASRCLLPTRLRGRVTRRRADPVRSRRSANGAIAGGIAARCRAAVEPADQRAFGVDYSDVELLGKFVTRDERGPSPGWRSMWPTARSSARPTRRPSPSFPAAPAAWGAIAGAGGELRHLAADAAGQPPSPGPRRDPAAVGRQARAGSGHVPACAVRIVLGLLEERLNADPEQSPRRCR